MEVVSAPSKEEFFKFENVSVDVEMFPKICRICFAEDDLNYIHETYLETLPSKILQLCTAIEVRETDNLPQNLCNQCLEKLYEAYYFIEACRLSDSKLKKVLATSKDPSNRKKPQQKSKFKPESDQKLKTSPKREFCSIIEIYGGDKKEGETSVEPFCEIIKIEYDPYPEELEDELPTLDDILSDGDDKNDCDENSELKFHCEKCNMDFAKSSNFSRHKYVHLDEKPHKCEACEKSFTRRESLNIHRKYHTGERHHECKYCHKSFTTISNYNQHVLQHQLQNGELTAKEAHDILVDITCTLCEKVFSSRQTLKTHMNLHSDKKYACDQCGKKFTFRGNLKSHQRSHSGERPFECHLCSKTFAFRNSLKEHIYTHTGERPHKCHYCSKGFSQNQQLKTHLRTHTGEKPFACGYCGKTFANKMNMKVHSRIHTGQTPYVCHICNKGFYDTSNLKKHIKRHDIPKDISFESSKDESTMDTMHYDMQYVTSSLTKQSKRHDTPKDSSFESLKDESTMETMQYEDKDMDKIEMEEETVIMGETIPENEAETIITEQNEEETGIAKKNEAETITTKVDEVESIVMEEDEAETIIMDDNEAETIIMDDNEAETVIASENVEETIISGDETGYIVKHIEIS